MFSDFLDSRFAGNSARDWLIALAIIAGSIIVSRLFYFISTHGIKKLFEKARGKLLYIVTDMLEEPLAIGIIIGGFYWAERRLEAAPTFDAVYLKIITFAVILDVTWLIARLLDDLIEQYVIPKAEESESKLDDQLLPILRKTANIIIWAAGIVAAIDNAGYNVGTIVAGLGIGGLAFAFAAQDTIGNLFGGVTIFVDAPFIIGDRIKVSGVEGWVREIGLRTSKLETLDGRRLTIPNAVFSKNIIENVSSEPATKVVESIGLSPTQAAGKIEKAIEVLKKIIAEDAELEPNSTAFFSDFSASSYDVTFVLWIKKGADLGAVRSRVNLRVLSDLAAAGIDLALPTHVVYNKE
jgi:MscS family membrane protein